MIWKVVTAAIAATVLISNCEALVVEFDYTYDTRGFFTDEISGAPIVERREALSHAASFFTGFSDQLTGINASDPGDSWSVRIGHPSFGGANITLIDQVIAPNTIKVYVGGSPSAPGVLGLATNGAGLMTSGSTEFADTVINRGQGVTVGNDAVDFAPWGGTIWFNANQNWHFGIDPQMPGANQPDFLTTAIHEIAHILGFGEADSWFSQIENGFFLGTSSVASYGGPVPLDNFNAHWASGTLSTVNGVLQDTLLDPSTPFGERQLFTELDLAGLTDIGWEIQPVPLPAAWILMMLGLFPVAMTGRKAKLKDRA
ncbi:MAG: PEP-CTERM sorting domain-containing protein [Pseudomonadota bacterium]